MTWLRERRRLRMFSAALRDTAIARRDRNELSADDCAKIVSASDKPKVMRSLMKQTEVEPGLYGGIMDWDWEAILKWVEEFFIPLIKALLPLLILLDEED